MLEGRKAIVTGGSGDIGGAICMALAHAGVDIALTYFEHVDIADQRILDIQSIGSRGLAIQLDQRDPNSIEQCVKEVKKYFGGIDILINNAAWNIGIPFSDLDALDVDHFNRILETNLRGPYLLVRECAELLKENSYGSVVNIASSGGISPLSSSLAYSASKAGLIHLTRCLAVALAPSVRVNCIAPGLVEGTRMAKRMPKSTSLEARNAAVLNRVGNSEDIAQQVLTFCCSTSVTGQVIVIDGGMPAAMR